MKTEYVEYRDADQTLEAYVAFDDASTEKRPCVLIAHDWTGRRAHACAGAERMAELGYVGFAVDIHGHDDPMVTPEQVLDFETEMSAANVDWQDHVYGGTSHAFTNPAANNRDLGTVYNQRASQRAGKALANFFHELFVEMPPLDVAP